MSSLSRLLLPLLAAALLAGCAQYASVRERRAIFQPHEVTVSGPVNWPERFLAARKHQHSQPLAALGEYLDCASAAEAELARQPGSVSARERYNFATSRVFETIRTANLDPWTKPLNVPSANGGYQLTFRPLKWKQFHPSQFEFTPADEFDVKGTYVSHRVTKDGVGAPLVAIGKEKYEGAKANFIADKIFYGVTGSISFTGGSPRRAALQFDDPLGTETVQVSGRTYPLAADFTVPVAVMLARENPKKRELARVLNPEKYAETAHIVRLQPYDPNKTVVVVTHGLMDSPATWTPMINELRGDPFIRQHYQFWFYSYPSGYPYPYSASIMREQLDAIEKRFQVRKPIVLIGHSMGSLISRLMITDSGDKLWQATFGKSPAETRMNPETKRLLENALIFHHRSEVGRVIFISGPHRGANMATDWTGRLGSLLVRTPRRLLSLNKDVRALMVHNSTALRLRGVPTSIDTLAPNNRFVLAINTVPITPGIPYHSIIGDRGKGGNKDKTPPVSTDGVVPYWSSHLEGAKSELVVPSNHSAHQNAQAIAEVRRILHLHAGGGR